MSLTNVVVIQLGSLAHLERQRKILVASFDATMQMQLQARQIIEQHQQQLLQLSLQLHLQFLQLGISEGSNITASFK